MKKIAHVLSGMSLIVLGALIGLTFYTNTSYSNDVIGYSAIHTPDTIYEEDTVTSLAFVGDIMLDRGVKGMVNKYFNGDYSQIFVNAGELKDYDVLFGNLEGPVSDKGNKVGSIYSFRMDPAILPILNNVGFDIVSFANNHVGDWNVAAFTDTLNRLNQNNILFIGAGVNYGTAKEVTVISKNGIHFGFIGLTDVGPEWIKAGENNPGILLASDPNLSEIIKEAKSKVDFLIVSFHWGDEYETIHNSRQEYLAKKVIDAGADAVIGHHPHVVQDIQYYKDKPIFYSLGNFVFDQYFSKETMQGMMAVLEFKNKNLVNIGHHSVQLNTKYQIDSIK